MILPVEHSRRILAATTCSLFSALFAYAHGAWRVSATAAAVWATSVNYWRHPVPGPRRTLDMVVALAGAAQNVSYAAGTTVAGGYAVILAGALYCYARARGCRDPRRSSLWHCGLHVVANAGNVLLVLAADGPAL